MTAKKVLKKAGKNVKKKSSGGGERFFSVAVLYTLGPG